MLSLLFLLINQISAEYDIGYQDDGDLTSFVTRPEIRAPLFKVTKYDSDRIDDGYWFLGPYADIIQQSQARAYYQPCQTGPHIYDGNGDLVWSGACQFVNQNACDFRPYEWNGTYYLSTILSPYQGIQDPRGKGIILDNSYTILSDIQAPGATPGFNMHEFLVIDNGNRALHVMTRPEAVDLTAFNETAHPHMGWIANAGFREVGRTTGETIFEWWAYPRVSLHEATVGVQEDTDSHDPWNFFHPNSVDKNQEGDYIISSRYTNTIYKVSGRDGVVLWRLSGGEYSSFELQGFNFSRQHDARWIESTPEYDMISFLDNGGDGHFETANVTTGLIVKMDKTTMKATVIKEWLRPDNRFSALRGNFQTLPSGNVFGGWSDNCHISEHSPEGDLLMEAEFASNRFVTYRAYKSKFLSNPPTVPDMKAFTYGFRESASVTVFYVSWNGATEVNSWAFFRESSEGPVLIGTVPRSGFETRFQTIGYIDDAVYVEALDRDGNVLQTSDRVNVEQPFSSPQSSNKAYTSQGAKTAVEPVASHKTEL